MTRRALNSERGSVPSGTSSTSAPTPGRARSRAAIVALSLALAPGSGGGGGAPGAPPRRARKEDRPEAEFLRAQPLPPGVLGEVGRVRRRAVERRRPELARPL